jgi:prepilin-type N-terminal cleavage/methylation domain-containing protein
MRFVRRRSPDGVDPKGRGFTLVELLVVMVILGVLASVVLAGVRGIVDRGARSTCTASVQRINSAAELYRERAGRFPDTIGALLPDYLASIPGELSADGRSLIFDADSVRISIVYAPESGRAAPLGGADCATAIARACRYQAGSLTPTEVDVDGTGPALAAPVTFSFATTGSCTDVALDIQTSGGTVTITGFASTPITIPGAETPISWSHNVGVGRQSWDNPGGRTDGCPVTVRSGGLVVGTTSISLV